MSEIKPVYQLRVRFNLWEDQTKKQYEDSKFGDGVPRILYPAAALEALQAENAELREQVALFVGTETAAMEQGEKSLCLQLSESNAAQTKRIQDLEGEDKISAAVIDRCVNLLAQIAITLKGEPKELTRHSYHDLPELVSVLHSENELHKAKIDDLEQDLKFIERWANHHGTKPNVTAQEALSCIQHYPSIAAITKSYKDGVIPKTRNPYAEIESLRKQVEELKSHLTAVVEEMNHLMNDSKGVAGLHLNGDIAPWASLLRGGEFDTWLSYLSDAAEYIQSKNGE